MELSLLTDEISSIIQDSFVSDTDIETRINAIVFEIAQGIQVPGELGLTAPLPELLEENTVDLVSTARSITLPDNYQRGLFPIDEVSCFDSFAKFIKRYPSMETGEILEAVVVHGKKLFYYPSLNKTVNILYYRKPEDAIISVEGIPEHLQRRLIVNGVCKDIFAQIEDGIEGQKVNTNYHTEMFFSAIIELDKFVKDDGLPEYIADDEGYIS